jgi:hypothetical protein
MAGYLIIEERMMQPAKPAGLSPHPNRLGMLDYLRELRQEVFPFPRGHKLCVVGLEEVLKAAGAPPDRVAGFIHSTLVARANELERMGGFVQIVFKSKLHHADDFWFEIGTRPISLRTIFGHVQTRNDNGIEYHVASFNLT